MAAIFFDAALALRVGSARSAASYAPLTQLEERSGIVGELAKRTLQSASDSPNPTYLTAWFATERVARAWQALHRSDLTKLPKVSGRFRALDRTLDILRQPDARNRRHGAGEHQHGRTL